MHFDADRFEHSTTFMHFNMDQLTILAALEINLGRPIWLSS